jgi:divalent metal cation (Fe/Co/Zn/Cd) transporter
VQKLRVKNTKKKSKERRPSLWVYSFYVLGAYILFESIKKLYLHEGPEPSLLGMIIAALSLIIMPFLAHLKYKTGKSMRSRSLVADSKQTFVCVLMSLALLFGTGLNFLFGLWWTDAVTGLVFVFLCFKEGRESIEEGKLCCH